MIGYKIIYSGHQHGVAMVLTVEGALICYRTMGPRSRTFGRRRLCKRTL